MMDFPEILLGCFWHTTSEGRFTSILQTGFILPEPPIPDSERWGTARGEEYYPFVRYLGGVSLFDFHDFDPVTYTDRYPMSMWRNFVPCMVKWETAMWIAIDETKVADKLIAGEDLVRRWKEDNQLRRKIMPIIEVAHIGPLPIEAFDSVYRYSRDTDKFEPVMMGEKLATKDDRV